mmetsp:Transcript_77018/g.208045  ORF Transcript_77018/g.208045 Transcript_77018/m.208045 type:complete len:136 (+) Transcript_77018:75-482(+)
MCGLDGTSNNRWSTTAAGCCRAAAAHRGARRAGASPWAPSCVAQGTPGAAAQTPSRVASRQRQWPKGMSQTDTGWPKEFLLAKSLGWPLYFSPPQYFACPREKCAALDGPPHSEWASPEYVVGPKGIVSTFFMLH